eukprot:jgi/Astpho2/7486/e_gw1.00114.113.1_t
MTHCYEQATEGGWGNLQAPACLTRALAWDSCRTSAWESPADCAGSCWWCRCPGVVGFLGSFEDGQHICLVQEHCAKGDLFKALLRQGGAMPEHRVCTEVVVPLLTALDALHGSGVMHRDIKPENLFLTSAGELRVGDFGLALNFRREAAQSRVGTLDYMAPERAASTASYGCSVDVWAVGILTFELLTGKPPFEVEDPDETVSLIMYSELDTFPDNISGSCISFIRQALIKSPTERPEAGELLHHPWIQSH